MRKRKSLIAAVFSIVIISIVAGCGGGNQPRPPSISVTVSPSTASVPMGTTQQFTPTVTGTTNTAVTWSVNGVSGGNSTVGTINAIGMYAAPSVVPSPASVTVTATSQADSTKSGNASATITSNVSVSVAPLSVTLVVNATQQFTATVTGTQNAGVTWSVNNVVGGNATAGTVSNSGFYMAPSVVPNPATVTVKATSVVDPAKSGNASVTITVVTQPTLVASKFVDFTPSERFFSVKIGSQGTIYAGGVKLNSTATQPIAVAVAFKPDLAEIWRFEFGQTPSRISQESFVLRESQSRLYFAGTREDTGSVWLGQLNTTTGALVSENSCQIAGTSANAGRLMRETPNGLVIAVDTSQGPRIITTADFSGNLDCSRVITVRNSGNVAGLWVTASGKFAVSGTFSCNGGSNNCSWLDLLDQNGNAVIPEKTFTGVFSLRVVEQIENGQSVFYVAGTQPPLTSIFHQKLKADFSDAWASPTVTSGNNTCGAALSNGLHGLIPSPQGGVTSVVQWENLTCTGFNAGAVVVDSQGAITYLLRDNLGGGTVAFGGAYDSTGKKLAQVGMHSSAPNLSGNIDAAVLVWQFP